jgi:group I intron endonuclease
MVDTPLHCSGVYAIVSLACGRMYIGSTVAFGTRWRWHRNELRRGRHGTPKLQGAWSLYGEGNFSFAILEIVPDRAKLFAREQYWLDFLETADYGLNTLHIVDQLPQWTAERRAAMSVKRMGHPVSAETREKLRQANLGKKTHSIESKARLRALNLGKKMPPNAIARTAASWTGKKHSPESREKMSMTTKMMFAAGYQHPWKGRKHSPETIAKLKGRKVSPETRAKVSRARKAYFARLSI